MIIGLFDKNKNQILNQRQVCFLQACKIIENYDFSRIDDGRYEVDGFNFYYIIRTYKTNYIKQDVYAEAHRKYIDFQYIIYGEELTGYADYRNPKRIFADYDSEKDLELFSSVSDESFFLLKKDKFIIFYPYEIHRPGLTQNETRSIRKVIFKIFAGG